MQCSFCPNPAAHPATGAVYGSRYIACHECVVSFWQYVRSVLYQKGKRNGGPAFYDHVAPIPRCNEARCQCHSQGECQ